MAKSVKLTKGKEFNFNVSSKTVSKYPWDEWFSGGLLLREALRLVHKQKLASSHVVKTCRCKGNRTAGRDARRRETLDVA
jgi:hypothetical protein